MSIINTGSIDNNFPVPGVNNSSQGFRSNFTGIKDNLEVAKSEITDLQTKVVLKSPLDGSLLNNDMDNTLISNALTQGFRRTTYNLGNNLSGSITIDVTRGDVQYGTVTGPLTLGFSKWPPAGTQANIELILTIPNYQHSVSLPATIDESKITIENYSIAGNTIKIPRDTNILHLSISTDDCGTTLNIAPVNRPRKAGQVIHDSPGTANLQATGQITTNYSGYSNEVQGVGTIFEIDLLPGRILLSDTNVVLGEISSIASNTQLFLTSNAFANLSGEDFRSRVPVGKEGDQVGAVMADETYLYMCIGTYDGASPIWRKMKFDTF